MCGRFTLIQWVDLAERFGIRALDLIPRYNIAPGQDVPVIIGGKQRRLRLFKWGFEFTPRKGGKKGYLVINARAETLETKSFRSDLQHRRCLVPADGFYEWAGEKGVRLPYRYSLKGGKLFAFAGLWRILRTPQGEEKFTFCIITTAANDLVRQVHDRMPAILAPGDESRWLDTRERDIKSLKKMLAPYPSEELSVTKASLLVNNPGNEGPDLINPD